jgi:hypothetical protein
VDGRVKPGHDDCSTSAASRGHSTLHGVVFAIFCSSPAVHRRRGAAPRPGHEIVGASRSRPVRVPASQPMSWRRSPGARPCIEPTPALQWRGGIHETTLDLKPSLHSTR